MCFLICFPRFHYSHYSAGRARGSVEEKLYCFSFLLRLPFCVCTNVNNFMARFLFFSLLFLFLLLSLSAFKLNERRIFQLLCRLLFSFDAASHSMRCLLCKFVEGLTSVAEVWLFLNSRPSPHPFCASWLI